MLNLKRETLIEQYISGYNHLDVPGMLKVLHQDVVFENYSNGDKTLETKGIQEFQKQAEKAVKLFENREISPKKWIHQARYTDVHLNYHAVLAEDFPDGNKKKGDEINLWGRTVFEFKDGLISKIQDYSYKVKKAVNFKLTAFFDDLIF
ncbi:nuclear transport factor 2 family protein [Algoriphagus limi]|uniref:Nuclear transport factor 2 family protein n=1 Tax=Algoriphagus limi TaxID=2975273 RepID=A0ABT2G102_9BACT|nr:nuclear transport factor 2 family protein [Algoriphagus limi]MCS5488949.1 nuclear transport factor 2 family protein [Algoriphagus limi]